MGPTQKELDAGKKEAMDIAEAAREAEWKHPSFVAELFMGRYRPELVFPYPEQTDEDKRIGDEYMEKVQTFLREKVDADQIDREGVLPRDVIDGLIKLGCFGMKIPKEYSGLGLSQVNYNRTVAMISSHCGNTAVWLSAHQSIGVPQPLKMFGTPEQKKKYLPRLATGAISAFALTEPGVGSDPAKMTTTAVPTEDGKFFIINGEKLWCTDGPDAEIIVLMARTPSKIVNGKEKKQITAFILETNTPGVETAFRCQFMGLKAISNGLMRFKNVRVPRENIILGEGQGLRLALTTLNTGRLTLPAACVGAAKRCLEITRKWANERVQWGAPIGRHEAVSAKIARMAAMTFAMEAVTWYTSALVDRGGADIRLEAAMAKLFCSEGSWKIIDDALQIRGGRGYETADSLKARGEEPIPMERMMRDCRINTIIEGSSEILRLFIAREALDAHMRQAAAILDPRSPLAAKIRALNKAGGFYAGWYPRQWFHVDLWSRHAEGGPLAGHVRYVARHSHKLARKIFHAMARYQLGLEKHQQLLGRAVDIGTDLFAMSATCARALVSVQKNPADRTPIELADLFCRQARERIATNFANFFRSNDKRETRMAGKFLDGKLDWLEEGLADVGSAGAISGGLKAAAGGR